MQSFNHTAQVLFRMAFVGAIAIVINVFLYQAYEIVAPEPGYNYASTCGENFYDKQGTEMACTELGGKWTASNGDMKNGYCNTEKAPCVLEGMKITEAYNLTRFVIYSVIGLVLLMLGTLIRGQSVVALGFTYGGLLTLFIGVVGYWGDMSEIVRLITAGAILAALLAFAWRKFGSDETAA
jgi:hypothetical protein